MAPHRTATGSDTSGRSIPLRVASRRRRSVKRNAAIITALVAFMVLITLAGRDQQHVHDCRAALAHEVSVLRERVSAGGLPAEFPQRSGARSDVASHYRYRPDNLEARSEGGRVGVICCAHAHALYLDTDGRNVVTYDGHDFRIRWMTEAEFEQQAGDLGLSDDDAPPE